MSYRKLLLMTLFVLSLVKTNAQTIQIPLTMRDVNPQTISAVKGGDTLKIQGGLRKYLNFKDLKGEKGNPIVIINEGLVIIQPDTTGRLNYGVRFSNCENIVFSGKGDPTLPQGIKISGYYKPLRIGYNYAVIDTSLKIRDTLLSKPTKLQSFYKKIIDSTPAGPGVYTYSAIDTADVVHFNLSPKPTIVNTKFKMITDSIIAYQDYYPKFGVQIGGKSSFFTMEGIEVDSVDFAAFQIKTDPVCGDPTTWRQNFTMEDVYVRDNLVRYTNLGEGFYIGYSFFVDGNAQCPQALPHAIKNIQVYNNHTINTGAEGIQVGCATDSCFVHDNIIETSGVRPFDVWRTHWYEKSSPQDNGLQIGEGTTGRFYNNIIKNVNDNGIMALGSGNVFVYNNIIDKTGGWGIYTSTASDTFRTKPFYFINNTIVNTGSFPIRLQETRFKKALYAYVWNNLIYQDNPGVIVSKSTNDSAQFSSSNNLAVNDPNIFVDFANGDYRLKSGSSATNQGKDVSNYITTDILGSSRLMGKYDIGAFENRLYTDSLIGCSNQINVYFSVTPQDVLSSFNVELSDVNGEFKGHILNSGSTSPISISLPGLSMGQKIRVNASTPLDYGIENFSPIKYYSIPTSYAITGPSIVDYNSDSISYSVPALSGATFQWSVNNQAKIVSGQGTNKVKINFVGENEFHLQILVKYGACSKTVIKDIISNIPNVLCDAEANFTFASTCLGQTTTFKNTSINTIPPSPTEWSVNNVPIASLSGKMDYTFTTAGKYIVKLRTGSNYCSTKVDTINISNISGIISGPSSINYGSSYPYSIIAIPGASYFWSVNGDGTITSGQNSNQVNVHFGNNSIKSIIVAVTKNGCESDDSLSLTASFPSLSLCPITSNFGYSTACVGQTTSFWNLSSSNAHVFEWSINDIPQSTASYFSYIFPSPGTYKVKLRVGEGELCATKETTIVIPDITPPISGPTDIPQNQTGVYFSIPSTSGASYNWWVNGNATIVSGNGTEAVSVNFGSNFTNIVVGVNYNGCYSEASKQLNQVPSSPSSCGVTADFGNSSICLNQNVSFWNLSSWQANTYEWRVNGTVVSTNNYLNYIFTNPGKYTVQYRVGSNGLCATTSRVFEIKDIAGPISGSTSVIPGTHDVAYSIPATSGASYNWWVEGATDGIVNNGTNSIKVNYSQWFTGGNLKVGVNSNGCYKEGSTYINKISNARRGVFEEEESNSEILDISVYPNPYTYGFTISVPEVLLYNSRILIYDSKGVQVGEYTNISTTTEIGFDLPSGVYEVKVITPQKTFNEKVVKL